MEGSKHFPLALLDRFDVTRTGIFRPHNFVDLLAFPFSLRAYRKNRHGDGHIQIAKGRVLYGVTMFNHHALLLVEKDKGIVHGYCIAMTKGKVKSPEKEIMAQIEPIIFLVANLARYRSLFQRRASQKRVQEYDRWKEQNQIRPNLSGL